MQRLLERNALRNGNAEVQLKLEDGTIYEEKGTLQLQEIAVDESTGAVTLRAAFPNTRRILMPGMFVRAIVAEAVHDNAVLVKQQAVTMNAKEEGTVMVLTPDNVVEERSVVTGSTVGNAWIIFEGLQAGDRVVLEGLSRIKPGDTVRPVELTTEVDDYPQDVATIFGK